MLSHMEEGSGDAAGSLPAMHSAQVDGEFAKELQQDYNFSSILNITLEATCLTLSKQSAWASCIPQTGF